MHKPGREGHVHCEIGEYFCETLNQGTLTEGEGSVPLTSSLRKFISLKSIFAISEAADIN